MHLKWKNKCRLGLKTLCEKETLLVTSNVSFSHNIFHSYISLGCQNAALFGYGLFGYGLLHNCNNLTKEAFENIEGKGENAGNRHLLIFPQIFLSFLIQNFFLTGILLPANAFSFDLS